MEAGGLYNRRVKFVYTSSSLASFSPSSCRTSNNINDDVQQITLELCLISIMLSARSTDIGTLQSTQFLAGCLLAAASDSIIFF
jgi:hypothetical protein